MPHRYCRSASKPLSRADAPGVTVVAPLLTVGALVTLVALVAFDPYLGAVERVQRRLVEDRRALAGFVASLALVPLSIAVRPF